MARKCAPILLGYDDEVITEKHKKDVNFTVNKLGGLPDYPPSVQPEPQNCPLCQLPQPLIVQVHAPLEDSPFQRTLYLFACINPNCWNQSESWRCIRVQTLLEQSPVTLNEPLTTNTTTEWCANADDWDSDDNTTNIGEENGNCVERVSEDDESCSFEESIRCSFGTLSVDDHNANTGDQGGAVGRMSSPAATAEIEGNEGEVISIDSPTVPQNDLMALLHEVAPLPREVCENQVNSKFKLQFTPYFISVWEETASNMNNKSDRHVKELLEQYQLGNESFNASLNAERSSEAHGGDLSYEKYEKSLPAHGDMLFHQFVSKIQSSPGQILRYCRDAEQPLLLQPLPDKMKRCQFCDSDLTFEFQLLPTIIPKLKLISDQKHCTRLEFGNAMIFTCRKSCWESGVNMRKETVILQSETY